MQSKIEYDNLVYWGAADGHFRDLDAIQRSALKLLQKPEQVDPPLPSLESRRQAAAVGLACKLLDGKGRGLLNELKPVFVDPTQPPPPIRVSARIVARTGGPQHRTTNCSMLQYVTELDSAPLKHTRGRSGSGYQEYDGTTFSITTYFNNKQQQHIKEELLMQWASHAKCLMAKGVGC